MTSEKLNAEIELNGYSFPHSDDFSILSRRIYVPRDNITLKNSLAVHPMEGGDFNPADHSPTEQSARRYLRLARGGAGLIWFEATAVQDDARSYDRQAMLTPTNIDSYKRLTDAVRSENPDVKLIIQLTHSGRSSKRGHTPAPVIAHHSDPLNERLKLDPDYPVVTDDYLDRLPETFAANALLAREAGFDGVDIKCCHLYLFDELLSAYMRPGRYGGCYENRAKLFLDTVSATRVALPHDTIIAPRLGMSDMLPYPWGFGVPTDGSVACELTETIRLIGDLRSLGVNLISLTMNSPYYNPNPNRTYNPDVPTAPEPPLRGAERMISTSAKIKRAFPDLTFAGAAYSFLGESAPLAAAGALADGMIDIVGFGRMSLAYPEFARDAITGEFDRRKACLACGKCGELLTGFREVGCPIRDSEHFMPIYRGLVEEKNK
jgi:NADH:flavin oxidoreductases, Old Yellow Enzyme family